jgi:hypothetical protein
MGCRRISGPAAGLVPAYLKRFEMLPGDAQSKQIPMILSAVLVRQLVGR